MTCNPCDKPHDLKGVIKDILRCVCANPDEDYDTLHFTEVDTEGGNNTWRCILIRFTIGNPAHTRLRNTLLQHPDTLTSSGRPDIITYDDAPWFEPPFTPTNLTDHMEEPLHDRTLTQIATFVKKTLDGQRQATPLVHTTLEY
jgi:hypothetical protein